MLLTPWYLQEASTGWSHEQIDFSWWSGRERNVVSDAPWPGDEIWEALDRKARRRTGEKRDGPDLVVAKIICHRMSNADGKRRK